MNVTGTSIFNDDVGVAADVNAEGNVTASQVLATQGISAVGGGIWIGDPNGTTYSSGITLGGGALSGAGVGGAQAFTGDVDAVAIGNNARAMMTGSLALGLDSSAIAVDAIAFGHAATAGGVQDVVVGAFNNTGAGGNNTLIGNGIDIIGAASSENVGLGVGHQVAGSGNFVGGGLNNIVGRKNVTTGVDSMVSGDSNVAVGDSVEITGDRSHRCRKQCGGQRRRYDRHRDTGFCDSHRCHRHRSCRQRQRRTGCDCRNAQYHRRGREQHEGGRRGLDRRRDQCPSGGAGCRRIRTRRSCDSRAAAGLRHAGQRLHDTWHHLGSEQGPPARET